MDQLEERSHTLFAGQKSD